MKTLFLVVWDNNIDCESIYTFETHDEAKSWAETAIGDAGKSYQIYDLSSNGVDTDIPFYLLVSYRRLEAIYQSPNEAMKNFFERGGCKIVRLELSKIPLILTTYRMLMSGEITYEDYKRRVQGITGKRL